jgi:xanthine/uracil/vitamin C permease (AzgA family)
MGKGAIFVGIIIILLSLILMAAILTSDVPYGVLIYPLVGIGIGIALIVFWKEEDIIEERKDKTKNLNKTKSN